MGTRGHVPPSNSAVLSGVRYDFQRSQERPAAGGEPLKVCVLFSPSGREAFETVC